VGLWNIDAARIAKVRGKPLNEAVKHWDRTRDSDLIATADQQRQRVLQLFPIEAWPSLPLERYALGTGVDDGFCWLMEFGTPALGGIGGGSAKKHLIYRKSDGTWYHRPDYANEIEAWEAVRAAFVRGFELAEAGDWAAIDALPAIANASSLRAKVYCTYFLDDHIPIFSTGYQAHFFSLLGGEGPAPDGVAGTRALRELTGATGLFEGWHPSEIATFLGAWSPRATARRIVKIAPGNDAQFWDACRAGNYICVGWDKVGDLKEFESKEEFRRAFGEAYPEYSPSKATEKANEVWSLMELLPGDIVLANKGIGQILGRGEVIEPGYSWDPDRGEWAFHTLGVEWEKTPPWEIEPIKHWAMTTVSPVSAEQYKRILEGVSTNGNAALARQDEIPPDRLLAEIGSTLERKGQLVLYGPPGSGKTDNARRFSVWWLSSRAGASEASTLLGDRHAFSRAEERLSTAQVDRRVWWLVANPKEWNWNRLGSEKKVSYRYGRLHRNYPLVQPGDLVIGYSSNPDKRIAAVARVSKALHTQGGEQQIELEFVADVSHGLTYEELQADRRLAESEPMRFRNQGTLFALTPDEADYLLALLRERDPELPIGDEDSGSIGQLTRVTFHPSYTYEDFVEGYKPIPTGTGQLDLRLTDGVFKRVCRAAQADPGRSYLLVVDEINRGNIPKIFGELITLLEMDKRGMTVVLPQSRETFSVPANVFLLGTMNTADRSIKLLDAALRRRFAFIELMPDTDPLSGGQVGDLELAQFLRALNAKIAKTEGREKQIGHSFLLASDGQPVSDPDEFAQRFRYEILPLLQEYSYEDYAELESYIGPRLVNVEDQSLNSDVLVNPQDLVDALRSWFQPDSTLTDQAAGPPDEVLAAVPSGDGQPAVLPSPLAG
jgi:5-methylcytosine-specific restriction protein B